MRIIVLIERIKNKIITSYRKSVFKSMIGCDHNQFSLVGKVTLINKNIKLGKNVTIYPEVMFWGDGVIEIGDNTDIGNGTILYASKAGGGITIGCNTVIAAQCYIIDMDHGTKSGKLIQKQQNIVSPINIGNDVWLGANVTVLKGSNIGDGSVIGAKALVKGKVGENQIAVGIPAKEIGERK